MYKEGENPKYATTQDVYEQMLSDGWTTKLIQTTTETTVGEEPEVSDNNSSDPLSTSVSSAAESMEDKDLDKTTKGLGLLANLSTALAGQLGIPVTALINAKAVAAYNDKLTDQSKRKGSIFGGEGSLYEGLEGGKDFGNTWLGDLLGFDDEGFGVQGDNLQKSFMGSRRDGDITADTTQLEGSTAGSSTKVSNKPSPRSTPTVIPTGATLKQGTVLNNDDDPVIFTKDNSGNTVGENRSTYGKTETTSASITAPGELV